MSKVLNVARWLFVTAVFAVLFSSYSVYAQRAVDDFSLKNVDGKMVSLSDYKDAKGFIIVFTCNHCPFAKLYPPRLNELH
jgi:hypothetical protein